ncbi:MAG TPA: tripartite tricarboxylate transporter substrate binding protein [Burkholderiales bacterium]|nr:tripartite tricarboxylate transporter substrate binding protein [Burkholderiales bacterium]
MRKCHAAMAATAVALMASGAAQSQTNKIDYPKRPVRLIVAQSPGGNADFVARLLAGELGKRLGQQFVVDNRPGGSGIIAADVTVHAPADGYTLLLVGSSFGTNPSLRKLPYDPLKDLAPITLASNAPNILVVNPSLPVFAVKDLVALARAKPGQLNYGSSATGGSTHLAGELFDLMAKTRMIHIPYKGAALALTEVMAGQIQLSFASMPSVMAHVRSGKLRAIAVTSAKRSALVPELPTIAESGLPGFETGAWQGIFAPRATPAAIVGLLNRELVAIVQTPEVRKAYAVEGGEPVGNSPEEFARWLHVEIAKWAKVVKAANIRVE